MAIYPIIICIIWMGVGAPEPRLEDDAFDDEKIVYRCDGDNSRIFEGLLLGYGGLLCLLGVFFAFRARKATSHFNEAKYVGIAVYCIFFCGVVGITLTYVLLGLPIGYYLVFCVCVMLGILSIMMIIYFPKIRIAIFQPEKNVYSRTSGSSRGSGLSTTQGADISD
tara:strand:+ start:1179 stop:1676 length:498 start_codon:yes stop_codon:yes gene_type:complete